MRNMRTSNPKEFWKILNSSGSRDKNCNSDISIDTLFDFFSDLNKGENDENDADVFEANINMQQPNDALNSPITKEEIEKAIKNLKNNKASGEDLIINEYLKHSAPKMIQLYVKIFNAVFDSGKLPEKWIIGNIIPIYKNKGSKSDPKNYRPITLVSCFGKLFTSVINERLQNYSDEYEIICENQAGFRKGYSTTDNLFILHTLTTLIKHNRKKLFCLFIDFEKAFDKVWRNGLWNKMMINNINGKMFSVIYNMYKCIKSRIVHNANVSEYFSCNVGLRQGENLSPFLFSLYLNDLEEFMYTRNVIGLESVSRDLEDDLNVFLKLFILLYADDTVLFSESITDLQLQLNVFKEYCDLWKLKVNVSKTKALVFSKGQLSKNLSLYFGNDKIEFVNNFNYLGLIFSRGCSFKYTLEKNVKKANIAMYNILKKGRLLNLSIQCQYDLFDKIVKPILLYGCEIWGFCNFEVIEKVHLKFCKLLLKVKKSTPNYMIYGEVGAYPLYCSVKSQMINYWINILCSKNNKLTSILYSLILSKTYIDPTFSSNWLNCIKAILDDCGLSYVWISQEMRNKMWLKNYVKQNLKDQFLQRWKSDVENSSKSLCYRIYKTNFGYEKYLDLLNNKDRQILCKFRICNHRFPIETGRWERVPREDRTCTLCNNNQIGDEFHYLMECKMFCVERKQYLGNYFCKNVNVLKFETLLNSHNTRKLRNICKFLECINKKVCPPS